MKNFLINADDLMKDYFIEIQDGLIKFHHEVYEGSHKVMTQIVESDFIKNNGNYELKLLDSKDANILSFVIENDNNEVFDFNIKEFRNIQLKKLLS